MFYFPLLFRYTLNLSDLQVMVGRAMDNWKHAHNKGTSHMHVVDKFSISLKFERFVCLQANLPLVQRRKMRLLWNSGIS